MSGGRHVQRKWYSVEAGKATVIPKEKAPVPPKKRGDIPVNLVRASSEQDALRKAAAKVVA